MTALAGSSPSQAKQSQLNKCERIVRAAGIEPYRVTLESPRTFVPVGIGANYATIDDDVSVVLCESRLSNQYNVNKMEENFIRSSINRLRRKGFFSHMQKSPVSRRDILKVLDTIARGRLLLTYYCVHWQSERQKIGNGIRIIWNQSSIALDYRGAILKSYSVAACRIKSLCSGGSLSHTHFTKRWKFCGPVSS